jgi:hypothetical protein
MGGSPSLCGRGKRQPLPTVARDGSGFGMIRNIARQLPPPAEASHLDVPLKHRAGV